MVVIRWMIRLDSDAHQEDAGLLASYLASQPVSRQYSLSAHYALSVCPSDV